VENDYTTSGMTGIFERTSEYVPPASWQTFLIGRPLQTADAPHQTIGKLIGLAVFSSDAMSSVAYGPQEVMTVLILAGTGALQFTFPLVVGIVVLLTILTTSYEQTIHAYPGGGGAYIVARDNLGELPAQTAGAALLTDYILTVAVSISAGVAALTSAYPELYDHRVWISVGMIAFIMVVNLRGVKESGITFAIPTYFFLIMMFITVGIGLVRWLTGSLGTVVEPPDVVPGVEPLALFLILRAFASGTASLTGVEAISNGITAFKAPRSRNAGATLLWMAVFLGSLLLGVSFLAVQTGAMPSEFETVVSQIARTVYDGRGPLYLATISAITVILMMAANTAFADFPRLGALHAGDGFLPRQLTYRGSRLVFSRGIMVLSAISAGLVILFQASVSALIPLYAIGVFLSFTLSQAGMTRRWWKSGHLAPGMEVKEPGSILRFDAGWRWKLVVNAVGSFSTLVVTIIFAVVKFREGAWIVVLLTPLLVTVFFSIHHHYKHLARQLSLAKASTPTRVKRNRVLILISGVHRGTLKALNYASTLSEDITAIHVSLNPEEVDKVKARWSEWGMGYRLLVLHSPYRLLVELVENYIDSLEKISKPGEVITIVVPQFIPRSPVTNILHMRTAESLRHTLLNRQNIVIIEVPYQVE
jgi:amino acid transporter